MAEDTHPKPSEEVKPPAADPAPEVKEAVTEPLPPTAAEPEEEAAKEAAPAALESELAAEAEAGEGEKDPAAEINQSVSFKEESNVVADLEDPEKKALDELKQLIVAALANNEFNPPPPPPPPAAPAVEEKEAPAAAADAPAEGTKPEEPAAPAAEVAAPEEGKTEEPAAADVAAPEEAKAEEPAAPAVAGVAAPEETKAEVPAAPAVAGVAAPEEPAPPADVATKEPPKLAEEPPVEEEKAVVVEGDGAKTVEAIEETVVSAAAAPAGEVEPAEPEAPAPPAEEIFIWGVPLLGDEKSDTVLLKFLRARDFKTKDALAMIKNAVIWRKQFGIDALVSEDLEIPELGKVVFNHGFDKEGHPVCYNVYGEFNNKEVYAKAFGDEEKRDKFLRWRIQFLEKGIRELLDFSPGGVCTMVQVTDLKNTPGPGKKALRVATRQALNLLQDNFPEFVAKQVFINVPWWYLAYNRVISPFLTQRSKSKFVFAGPSKSAETLFKYIAPEQVPVQYGGLSMENDSDFATADAVTEVTIKPATKHTIEIEATETCLLVWELRVLGWDVSYGAEFVPSSEDGYTVIVQKSRKFVATDEPVVKNSFKIGEPGKVVLTIDNASNKKKLLLYRSKTKTATESN